MASSSLSTLSLQVLLRFSHAEFTWIKDTSTSPQAICSRQRKQHGQSKVSASEEKKMSVKMILNAIYYLINTFLYHRFIRFPTGSHELCALVLNHIELFLQPVNLLLKSLKE